MKEGRGVEKVTLMLRERIDHLLRQQKLYHPEKRILIALAGVPGSGKSTICAALLQALREHGIDDVSVLPMDGFHHTRATLSSFSDPDLAFQKRGAPFTFDAMALLRHVVTVKQLPVTECDEPEIVHTAPSFDHAVGDPVLDAISISSRCRIVILEGNYVLLNEKPWNKIAELADDRWFVDVVPEVARERIVQRHIQAGIEKTRDAATLRADNNDMPNGEYIRSNLIEPNIRILN
ncbi:phosphoribulokinase/uridine kinase [Dactylonectria estremocensis]|uniref:Phosphoribulokinase/uridine kinase n=1 Tax=Dactylonectria estremocensis TaxID=1079267 RepID=A0A9P9IJI6_9HYPO|nr:phosphoribulokinase/uridine kinase [Dactylonectria estremocensis]